MARRLLLLGGTGRLGRAVLSAAPGWTVEAPGRAELDFATVSADGWKAALEARRPDVVLNCAAHALVDACETDRGGAEAVNATAPGRIAAACAALAVPLLHISTDYAFGGRPGPFVEGDATGPVQHYGVTKVAGEEAVLSSGARASVARISWLFGPTSSAFAGYVLDQVDGSGAPVRVHSRQTSRPTFAPTLVAWLLGVAELLAVGVAVPPILHPAGGPWASRAEWARAILDAAGHTDLAVVDQGDDGIMRAARPLDSRLDGDATMGWSFARGLPPVPNWRELVAYRVAG